MVGARTGVRAARPDVAVLDVRLPDGNGIGLCRDLLAELEGLCCLVLTSYTDEHAVLDAIVAGASGYVVENIKGTEPAEAIEAVGAGRSLLDDQAAEALGARPRTDTGAPAGLTEQERKLRAPRRPARGSASPQRATSQAGSTMARSPS